MDWATREVPETDAWNEPPGTDLRYQLVCELLDAPPQRTLVHPSRSLKR